jgi:hypothetical protein
MADTPGHRRRKRGGAAPPEGQNISFAPGASVVSGQDNRIV